MVSTSAPITIVGKTITLEAAVDLSAKQFYPVKLVTGGKCNICTAATDVVVGILLNDPRAGEEGVVGLFGIYQVVFGATTAAGDRLTSNGTGEAIVTTTAADWVFGIALAVQATGDIGPAIVGPFGYV